MKNTYKVKLYTSDYVKVDGEYKRVDASRTFTFKDWDDVQNLIRYLAFGADGAVKLEIETIGKEE